MNKNDKEPLISKNKDLVNLLNGLKTSVNNNSRSTTGMDFKNKIKNSVIEDLNGLNQDFRKNEGNLVDTLIANQRKTNNITDREMNRIIESISDTNNDTMIGSLLNSMNGNIGKIEDLMMVTAVMPQLKDTKKSMIGGIMSPDDNTQQLVLKLTDNTDKNLSDTDSEFYKEIRTLLNEDYELVKNAKLILDTTLTTGRGFVAVESYASLFSKIIVRDPSVPNATKRALKIGESVEFDPSEIEIINESAVAETFISKNNKSKSVVDEIRTSISECMNDVVISGDAISLFNESVLEQEISNKFNIKIDNNKTKKNEARIADGLLAKELDVEEQLKNITGCKIKVLDPRRTLPLKIDDTILGYYYIENKVSSRGLANPLNHNVRANVTNGEAMSGIEAVYQSLGNALIKKLDNKFIEDNAAFKDELYNLIKYTYDSKSTYQVTYLKPEDVVEFEVDNGRSPFEGSILYGKLYMMLLMSSLIARVARSNDIRAYYINTDANGNVTNQVMNAMNNLQTTNRNMLVFNSFQRIMSNTTVFSDIFLPRATNGNNPIDFDIIAGQSVDLPTDMLEMLEQIAVDCTGYPLQIQKSSNDVDFAKSYETSNIKAMKTLRDMQVDLNPSFTKLIRKILKSHYGTHSNDETDKRAAIVNTLNAAFQSPMNLVLTNFMDLISNAKDTATSIAEVVVGSNNTDEASGEYTDELIFNIISDLVPSFDFDKYKREYEDIKIRHAVMKNAQGTGEDDASAEDMSSDGF